MKTSKNRGTYYSPFTDDWMELVTEFSRQSGLTDAAWCEAQGISPSCFYNAVSRLCRYIDLMILIIVFHNKPL